MGKIMHAGIEYGGGAGGTDVEANPTGTPTDELNSIRIGSDIFEIVGGGGSGGGSVYNSTNLYSNSGTSVVNITLSDSVDNYDALYFECIRTADSRSYIVPYYMTTDDLLTIGHFQLFGYNEYLSYDVTNSTTFTKVNNNGNWYIKNIYGIKFGSGSGSGQINYSTTEQVIGTWIDGKPLYRKVLSNNGNALPEYNDVSDLNIETLVYTNAVGSDGANYGYPKWSFNSVSTNSNRIMYMPNANQLRRQGSFNVYAIIIEYTKTTD